MADVGVTRADDPLLLYFTSGTTARPKLVEHTHASYPVGHLSTMYWIGLQPGDIHLNISSPGWAKHAWSCLFAPWNAGATIVLYNYAPLRRGGAARPDGPAERDHVLRAAHRLADAHPGGPLRAPARAARVRRRRGAAEPRGDRAGAARLGHHHPRRVRPDRDDGSDRQPSRAAGQARLDGTPAARLRDRRWSTRSPARSVPTARSASSLPRVRGADARLHATRPTARARRCAAVSTTPVTSRPRRGGLHHLRRPLRRRVQGQSTTGSARSSSRAC